MLSRACGVSRVCSVRFCRGLPILRTAQRSFSKAFESSGKSTKRLSKTAITVLATTGAVSGLIVYLEQTSRLQLFNYAETHRNGSMRDSPWRNRLAMGLIDLYRQPRGPQLVHKRKGGKHLARWVVNSKW